MSGVPLVAVVLTQPESVRLLPGQIPAYGSPEAAVRALARAAGYGAWRAGPRGHLPAFAGIRTADARSAGPRVPPAGPGLARPRTDR